MPGGRKKSMKKQTQEEEDGSKNLRRSLANHGFSAEMSDHIVRAWPGREPFNTPEKETRAQAKECGVCKARTDTKKCSGCYSAWFCGVECQRIAWKDQDHKTQCKVETEDDLIMLNIMF